MKIKVGLDIGGSTTKIVGINDGKLVAKAIVKAADPVASAYGAVGKLVNDNNLMIEDSIDVWIDVLLKAKQRAAFLAQGDITLAKYKSDADYSFASIIHEILKA